jgi:hypothetical protein
LFVLFNHHVISAKREREKKKVQSSYYFGHGCSVCSYYAIAGKNEWKLVQARASDAYKVTFGGERRKNENTLGMRGM